MPGYDIQVLDDSGKPVEAGRLGKIVVKLPLPPSSYRRCGTRTIAFA